MLNANRQHYDIFTNSSIKENGELKHKISDMEFLLELEKITSNITKEKISFTVYQTMKLYDTNYPYSFNYTISNLLSSSFCSEKELYDIYLTYLKTIQTKEEEIDKNNKKIIDIFIGYISKIQSQEAYFLIDKMINLNLADKNITKKINTRYFAHYKIRPSYKIQRYGVTERYFYVNYDKLSKNDWELHKKYIEEGVNPNEIAKIIRNDELEKLQKVSSHEKFDFNQTIEPSLYERCSFINHYVTLIDYAAFFSSVKCFKYLLMNGAKINNTGKYAIAGGNIEIIHLCEQNHSSFKDAYKTAIEFHKNDIFKYLYENKIGNIDNVEELGSLCIKLWNTEIFTYLQKNGLEISENIINSTASNGNLYLIKHFLKEYPFPKDILIFSADSGNIELVEYILKQEGIDINAKSDCGQTALMEASVNGHTEIVQLLLEQEGIDINAKDKYGWKAIIFASKYGYTEIVKLLLEQEGIDVNVKNDYGDTPLILASEKGHLDIFKLLLEQKGIDINIKDEGGMTAFMNASYKGNIETAKLLLEQEGIDINIKDYNGWTSLMYSSRFCRIEMVKLLLEQKEIDINAQNIQGWTALMYASYFGHAEIVKLLLEQKGIDTNAQNKDGSTALICASLNGKTEIVKLLLQQKKVDINIKDNNGDTALNKASIKGFTEIVELFK